MQNTREVLKNIGYIFLKIYFCSLNNSLNIKVLFFLHLLGNDGSSLQVAFKFLKIVLCLVFRGSHTKRFQHLKKSVEYFEKEQIILIVV